jgi:hypothetical protein
MVTGNVMFCLVTRLMQSSVHRLSMATRNLPSFKAELSEDNRVSTHAGARAFLESVTKRRIHNTYQELTNAFRILPSHSIERGSW